MNARRLLFLCLACLGALLPALSVHAAGTAELAIDLPMGPYWRPGKYMPVHVQASIPDPGEWWVGVMGEQPVIHAIGGITGKGAVRTSIGVRTGRIDIVVPWLVMDDRAQRPRLFIENRNEFVLGPQLRRLADSERLVGWTTPDEPFARQLIKAPRLIGVQLDPARPIRGSAAAWELLDAVILDADSAARLDPGQLEDLVASGVIVAIKTDRPPLPQWPWKRTGDYAVLACAPVGPLTTGYHETALAPAQDWEVGWSPAFRRLIVLLAIAVCVPLLALALWRPPHLWAWTLLYLPVAIYGLGKWWTIQAQYQQAAGEIVILQDGFTQTDVWAYQTAWRDRVTTLRWNHVARPIFASRAGLDDMWLSINCDITGRPKEFDLRLPARRKVAFLSRMIGARSPRATPQQPVLSPLKQVAEQMYLPDGGRIIGQLPTVPPATPAYGYVETRLWNAVVIDRRGSATRPAP